MSKRGRERWKDPAYACKDCEEYYDSYSPKEKERRVQASCRHRSEHKPAPKTPPGFWEIDFPTSPEIWAQGMTIDATNEPAPPLNPYGRRRLRRWRKLRFEAEEEKAKEENEKKEQKQEKKEESEKRENWKRIIR